MVAAATADGSDIRTLLGHPHHEDDNQPLIIPNYTTVNGKAVDPLDSLIREFIQQDLTYIPIIDYKTVAITKLPGKLWLYILFREICVHNVNICMSSLYNTRHMYIYKNRVISGTQTIARS